MCNKTFCEFGKEGGVVGCMGRRVWEWVGGMHREGDVVEGSYKG